MRILPLETPRDEQLAEILGMRYFASTLLVIVLTLIILYGILFLIRRSLLRSLNSSLEEQLADAPGIRLVRNRYGILQAWGRYDGRSVRVLDSSTVWAHPRPVSIIMSHGISDIPENEVHEDITISRGRARKVLPDRPEWILREIDLMAAFLSSREGGPDTDVRFSG